MLSIYFRSIKPSSNLVLSDKYCLNSSKVLPFGSSEGFKIIRSMMPKGFIGLSQFFFEAYGHQAFQKLTNLKKRIIYPNYSTAFFIGKRFFREKFYKFFSPVNQGTLSTLFTTPFATVFDSKFFISISNFPATFFYSYFHLSRSKYVFSKFNKKPFKISISSRPKEGKTKTFWKTRKSFLISRYGKHGQRPFSAKFIERMYYRSSCVRNFEYSLETYSLRTLSYFSAMRSESLLYPFNMFSSSFLFNPYLLYTFLSRFFLYQSNLLSPFFSKTPLFPGVKKIRRLAKKFQFDEFKKTETFFLYRNFIKFKLNNPATRIPFFANFRKFSPLVRVILKNGDKKQLKLRSNSRIRYLGNFSSFPPKLYNLSLDNITFRTNIGNRTTLSHYNFAIKNDPSIFLNKRISKSFLSLTSIFSFKSFGSRKQKRFKTFSATKLFPTYGYFLELPIKKDLYLLPKLRLSNVMFKKLNFPPKSLLKRPFSKDSLMPGRSLPEWLRKFSKDSFQFSYFPVRLFSKFHPSLKNNLIFDQYRNLFSSRLILLKRLGTSKSSSNFSTSFFHVPHIDFNIKLHNGSSSPRFTVLNFLPGRFKSRMFKRSITPLGFLKSFFTTSYMLAGENSSKKSLLQHSFKLKLSTLFKKVFLNKLYRGVLNTYIFRAFGRLRTSSLFNRFSSYFAASKRQFHFNTFVNKSTTRALLDAEVLNLHNKIRRSSLRSRPFICEFYSSILSEFDNSIYVKSNFSKYSFRFLLSRRRKRKTKLFFNAGFGKSTKYRVSGKFTDHRSTVIPAPFSYFQLRFYGTPFHLKFKYSLLSYYQKFRKNLSIRKYLLKNKSSKNLRISKKIKALQRTILYDVSFKKMSKLKEKDQRLKFKSRKSFFYRLRKLRRKKFYFDFERKIPRIFKKMLLFERYRTFFKSDSFFFRSSSLLHKQFSSLDSLSKASKHGLPLFLISNSSLFSKNTVSHSSILLRWLMLRHQTRLFPLFTYRNPLLLSNFRAFRKSFFHTLYNFNKIIRPSSFLESFQGSFLPKVLINTKVSSQKAFFFINLLRTKNSFLLIKKNSALFPSFKQIWKSFKLNNFSSFKRTLNTSDSGMLLRYRFRFTRLLTPHSINYRGRGSFAKIRMKKFLKGGLRFLRRSFLRYFSSFRRKWLEIKDSLILLNVSFLNHYSIQKGSSVSFVSVYKSLFSYILRHLLYFYNFYLPFLKTIGLAQGLLKSLKSFSIPHSISILFKSFNLSEEPFLKSFICSLVSLAKDRIAFVSDSSLTLSQMSYIPDNIILDFTKGIRFEDGHIFNPYAVFFKQLSQLSLTENDSNLLLSDVSLSYRGDFSSVKIPFSFRRFFSFVRVHFFKRYKNKNIIFFPLHKFNGFASSFFKDVKSTLLATKTFVFGRRAKSLLKETFYSPFILVPRVRLSRRLRHLYKFPVNLDGFLKLRRAGLRKLNHMFRIRSKRRTLFFRKGNKGFFSVLKYLRRKHSQLLYNKRVKRWKFLSSSFFYALHWKRGMNHFIIKEFTRTKFHSKSYLLKRFFFFFNIKLRRRTRLLSLFYGQSYNGQSVLSNFSDNHIFDSVSTRSLLVKILRFFFRFLKNSTFAQVTRSYSVDNLDVFNRIFPLTSIPIIHYNAKVYLDSLVFKIKSTLARLNNSLNINVDLRFFVVFFRLLFSHFLSSLNLRSPFNFERMLPVFAHESLLLFLKHMLCARGSLNFNFFSSFHYLLEKRFFVCFNLLFPSYAFSMTRGVSIKLSSLALRISELFSVLFKHFIFNNIVSRGNSSVLISRASFLLFYRHELSKFYDLIRIYGNRLHFLSAVPQINDSVMLPFFQNDFLSFVGNKRSKRFLFVSLNARKNNSFFSFLNRRGKLLAKVSSGMLGYKGPKRTTFLAAHDNIKHTAITLGRRLRFTKKFCFYNYRARLKYYRKATFGRMRKKGVRPPSLLFKKFINYNTKYPNKQSGFRKRFSLFKSFFYNVVILLKTVQRNPRIKGAIIGLKKAKCRIIRVLKFIKRPHNGCKGRKIRRI